MAKLWEMSLKWHPWSKQTPSRASTVPGGHRSCMVSWTTASRHITGPHMEANCSLNCNSVPASHLTSAPSNILSSARTDTMKEKKRHGTYFVSRWEVLQSLLRVPKFICIHLSWQSKTWPLITAWLLCKGAEDTGRRFTHLTSLRWSSRGKNSCWFACQARHKFLLVGWFDREFSCAIVCRYSPVFHSFMPIQIEGRAAGEKAGFSWRGVTESGTLDSSLSFLNRLSVGKAMANAPHGQVSSYKPSGCIEQLHAFSEGWPHGSYPKPRARVNIMNEPRWHTVGSNSQADAAEQGRLQLLQRLSCMHPPCYPSIMCSGLFSHGGLELFKPERRWCVRTGQQRRIYEACLHHLTLE